MLTGDALSAFNNAANTEGTETTEHLQNVIEKLKAHVFPANALKTQKRYLRQFVRKPREMQTREFVARVGEMVSYLEEFPEFNNNGIQEDKLMEMFEFSIPATWQKTMQMHGFNAAEHTRTEFVEFCKRIEFVEGTPHNSQSIDITAMKPSTTGATWRAKSSARGKQSNNGPTNHRSNGRDVKRRCKDTWCKLHQVHGHDTGKCKVVKQQIKQMRNAYNN